MGKAIKAQACAALLLFLAISLQASEADFPIPDSIRPAVQFWVKVYTEVDTNHGFLHDAENLAVVYAAISRDRDVIEQRRNQIVADLKVLASGKREGLSESQQRMLALWGGNASNARLARAAENVRWQLGQSDRFLSGLKRSGAYRRHIEAVVQSKKMPIELAALPHVESSFHPGAYSSAAATGMWQFMRGTAQRFMQVDQIVDDRLDPYTATYGAMELLEYNYNALGTWPLALTAYNHGTAGMARAVKATGTTDIGRIIAEYKGSRFGFASRNFYPQFLAVLEVERRAEEFWGPIEFDRHPEFTEFELTHYVDARGLASSLGLDLEVLRRDNPALQPAVWSGTKRIPKGYRIKVDRAAFRGDIAQSFSSLPSQFRFSEQIPDLTYTVRSGDSLSLIATRYDTSVSELVAINQLRDRHRIRVGQELILPQAAGAIPTLLAEAGAQPSLPMPEDGRYVVQRGDTLTAISARFSVPEETLLSLNRLSNRDLIYPGQTLSLTGALAEAASAPEPVTVAMAEAQPEPLAVGPALEAVLDAIEEDAELAQEQAALNEDVPDEEAQPQLAQLSLDSDNTALAVDEAVQVAEAQEQLLSDLAADPSDYSVAADRSIEIQATETLGHYAEWLGVRAADLRRLNGLSYGQPVIIGNRLKLDFSKVDTATFENRRRQYHRDLQTAYFDRWRIKGTEKYSIRNRDILVNLISSRSIPLWLFRQYNPEVDSSRMQVGQELVFPVIERVDI